MATDASMNSMTSASMGGNMQGAMDGLSTQLANPGMIQSAAQMVENTTSVAFRRGQGTDHAQRVSAVLRQAWKEDQDAGHLLGSLYEVFGEAIFSLFQPPEMPIFV
jgi:transcription initiation factor TFIID subunit 6